LVGWSEWSPVTATDDGIALMENVPSKPLSSPARDDVLTSDLLLQADWSALDNPENGGAIITSYHLQYDDSSEGSTWTDLIGYPVDDVSLSFGVIDSITIGEVYRFRYRA
jgi:hypothetical protein